MGIIMTNYIAVIHKEKKSDFGVSFPDFLGCITAGKTVDDAKDMAQEALEGHVAVMLDDGLPLPAPSSLEEILKDSDYKNAAAYFIVSVKLPKKEPVRFNASIDSELLSLIDERARQFGMTRSGFIAEAARKELGLRE
jgi:predicted RNase H-like HicB family nuclease